MTKKIIIIVGIVLILLLLAFWSYLLFFGPPTSTQEVFTDLGFSEPTAERPNNPEPGPVNSLPNTEQRIDVDGTLEQLTTRPVAGFQSIVGSTTNQVLYTERGIGHIYSINLSTGQETRISNLTIPKAVDSIFSPAGGWVVVLALPNQSLEATIINLTDETSEVELPQNATNIQFLSENSLAYTVVENNQTTGFTHNLFTGEINRAWSIPLTEIDVFWYPERTVVVNKPAHQLTGSVYEIQSGTLVPIHEPILGLHTTFSKTGTEVLETYRDAAAQTYVSRVIDSAQASGTAAAIALIAIPEKCAFQPNSSTLVWCGGVHPDTINSRDAYLQDWLQGTVTAEDSLWRVNYQIDRSEVIVDFTEELGYVVDVDYMSASADGERLFFINRINNNLYTYRISSEN